jgi:hypothetical protein
MPRGHAKAILRGETKDITSPTNKNGAGRKTRAAGKT